LFTTDLLILGAGLTGLSAAHTARQAGLHCVVVDQANQAGGVLQSQQSEGFTLDFGANSFALTPEIRQLLDELALTDQVQLALPAGNKRYLFRDGNLHAVAPTPSTLLHTRLLSLPGKLRLLLEPLIKARRNGNEETVAQFFQRRIGREAFQYLIEPVLTGIYAGDATRMSVQAVMPQMVAWEDAHGSLLGGLRHQRSASRDSGQPGRQIATFPGGMATLIRALAQPLGSHLHLRSHVERIRPLPNGDFWVDLSANGQHQTWQASQVLWTLPTQAAPALMPLDQDLPLDLQAIEYPPMLMYALGYQREAIHRKLDSFGFLVPSAAQQPLLGAIWNSTLFPGKAPAGQALFTLFIGGAKHKGATEADLLALAQEARAVFERVMFIQGQPTMAQHYYWRRAIPQYALGHSQLVQRIHALEQRWPGFFVSANWLDGVSVGDRVKGGMAAAAQAAKTGRRGGMTVVT
jgi:oxygen-dependent protoporphyrinogen oxidase